MLITDDNVPSLFWSPYARDVRGSVLEQSLRKLGVEKLNKDDVQRMQWEVLEAKIGNWIHYMRIAVRIYAQSCSLIIGNLGAIIDFILLETGQTSLHWGEKNM